MTIRELRMAAGMTQKALAESLGISKRAIESWEGGQRTCPPYVTKLIEYWLRGEGYIK